MGTEGYSPKVLRKAVRQAGKAASFRDASDDLRELAEVSIGSTHLQRLSERVGGEWAAARDAEVAAYRSGELPRGYGQAPAVAAVMLDGGRYQARAAEAGRGVHEPGWKETKVGCFQTYAGRSHHSDPQPQPPKQFLDPEQVSRLAAQMQGRSGQAKGRSEKHKPRRRTRRRPPRRPQRLVRTVVATTANNEAFGWQVAAEVHRRGLDKARRKACVADGSAAIWSLFATHLLAAGFVGILDFLHLLVHLYAAAGAAEGKGTEAAWALYSRWLCLAWSGQVVVLLAGLRAVCKRLGPPPSAAKDDDPRQVAAATLGYVQNNRERMNYPQYRQWGLPISSAPVESTIKQLNRRVKGSEKFWLGDGAEAILQIRAAYLSEDDRVEKYWQRPRPYAQAVGGGRLGRRPVAAAQ